MKVKDEPIKIEGDLSATDVIYRLFNAPSVRCCFKKKGFVDYRFPVEISSMIFRVLTEKRISIEQLRYLGFELTSFGGPNE